MILLQVVALVILQTLLTLHLQGCEEEDGSSAAASTTVTTQNTTNSVGADDEDHNDEEDEFEDYGDKNEVWEDDDDEDEGEDEDDLEEDGESGGSSGWWCSFCTNHSLQVAGQERRYELYVPSGSPSSLGVFFHGSGGHDAAWANKASSDAKGYIIALPIGQGTTWDEENAQILAADEAFIDELVPLLKTEYAIPDGNVYAFGFSAGSGMAWTLGCKSSLFSGWVAGPPGAEGVPQICNGVTKKSYISIGCQDDFLAGEVGGVEKVCPTTLEYVKAYATANRGCADEDATISEEDSIKCHAWPSCAGLSFCQETNVGHTWPATRTATAWDFLTS